MFLVVWEVVDFVGFINIFLIVVVRVILYSEVFICIILFVVVCIIFCFIFVSSIIKFGGICFIKYCRVVVIWIGV